MQIKRLTSIDPNTGRTRVERGELERTLRGQSEIGSLDDLTPEQLQQVLNFDRLATQSSMASPTRSSTNQSRRSTVDRSRTYRDDPRRVSNLNENGVDWRGRDGNLTGDVRPYSEMDMKNILAGFRMQDPDTHRRRFSEWVETTPMRRGDYQLARELENYYIQGFNKGGQIPSMQYFATPNPQRVVQSAEQMALFGPHTPLPTADTDVIKSKFKSILKYVIPASKDTMGLEIIDYIIRTLTGGQAVVRTTQVPKKHIIRTKPGTENEPYFDDLFNKETGQGALFANSATFVKNLDTISTTEPGLITEFIKMLVARNGGKPLTMNTNQLSPEGFKWRQKARDMGLVEFDEHIAPAGPTTGPIEHDLVKTTEFIHSKEMLETTPTLFRNTGGPIFESQSKIVPGIGSTDTVPAMLTPGEFVINKQSTRDNLPLLHAINDGNVSGYAKGGMIPQSQYLALGGITERLAQRASQSKRLSKEEQAMHLEDIYARSSVADAEEYIIPTFRLKGQDEEHVFAGLEAYLIPDPDNDGTNIKSIKREDFNNLQIEDGRKIKIVPATPQGLLEEAIRLRPEDIKLQKMLSNIKDKNFNDDEVHLLDSIIASMSMDASGKPLLDLETGGLALVLSSLTGNEKATAMIDSKLQSFYSNVKKEKQQNIEKNQSYLTDKDVPANWDDLAMVHSTRHNVEKNKDGSIILDSTGYHQLGDNIESAPRSTIHFTTNGEVTGGFVGAAEWGDANRLIVTSGRSMVNENNNPTALNSIDTLTLSLSVSFPI